MLTWPENCVVTDSTGRETFLSGRCKTLRPRDNSVAFEIEIKGAINWNVDQKSQHKHFGNQVFNELIILSFEDIQGQNKLYKIFSSKNRKKGLESYDLLSKFFDQHVKNGLRTYGIITKIAKG